MPDARPQPHPLRVAIIAAGYPNYSAFFDAIGQPRPVGSAVMNRRVTPYPAFRHACAEALGIAETELFPAEIGVRE